MDKYQELLKQQNAIPRSNEATIKVSDVLNAEGTHPDMEKLKDWAKKNIKDPMRAAGFVATVEAESRSLGIGAGLDFGQHSEEGLIKKWVINLLQS